MPKRPQWQRSLTDVIGKSVYIARIVIGEECEKILKRVAKRNNGLARVKTCLKTTATGEHKVITKETLARWG